jgi:GNAT superfamily N-acetyltransferase
MPVQLREVKTNSDLSKFINFPLKLYRKNRYYVPALASDEKNTLSPKKNFAFQYCEARYWLAYNENRIVGRIAAILNKKHIQKWNQPYLRFGWLDFIDDYEVSSALMGAVESWAVQCGMSAVHGPLGFTDLDREGMLIQGFDELSTMATNYSYPYYQDHLEKLGYKKDIDWVEFEIIPPPIPNAKISSTAELVLRRNELTLLNSLKKKELMSYGEELFNLINEEYCHLYGTIPLSREQISQYISQYFGFVHPDFVPIVVDKTGRMIAFGIAMPSLSEALLKSRGRLFPFGWYFLLKALHKNNRADLYLIAIKKEYQGKGVNAVILDAMSKTFIKRGIVKVESNPELENNISVQTLWKYFELREHKRRRCYIKYL